MKKNYLLYFVLLLPLGVFCQDIYLDQKVVPLDREDSDQLGKAIAIDGNYAVIGVEKEDDDVNGNNTLFSSGSAYIFERSAGVWSQVQKIVANDRGSSDEFGYSVGISGDYIVVGARQDSEDASGSNTLSQAGSAYIFKRNGSGVWSQVQKIVASDRAASDKFGVSVAIDGDHIVVGADSEDEDASNSNTVDFAGSAYVFQNNGSGVWNETQKIVAPNRSSFDNFGYQVAIEGETIAVGCPFEDHDASDGAFLSNAGSVYVFEKDIYDTWQFTQKVVASDRAATSFFGNSVSLSGNYLVAGANFERRDASGGNSLNQAGAAYAFEKRADGEWYQMQKLVPSDRAATDQFAYSVAISGGYIVASAHNEDEDASGVNTLNGAGSAYVFELNNGMWSQEQKIVANDRSVGDKFGTRVAISGPFTLVSAELEDQNAINSATLNNSGSAYFFNRNAVTYSGGSWSGGSGASGEPTSADSGKQLRVLVGATSLSNSAEVGHVSIASGASLSIEPNNSLTVTGTVTLEDTESLILESDASGTASIINDGVYHYNNSASIKAERFLHLYGNGLNNLLTYHYIGSPVNSHPKFTDMADSDLYGYRESDLTWFYHEDFTDSFENFSNGEGYAIRYNAEITKAFSGPVNNNDFQVEITLSDHGGSAYEGFNLLANPYPSSLNAGAFVTENSSLVGTTIYLWNGLDYSTYNTALSSGTAGAFGAVPDGNIALGQAFMVEATTSGTQMVSFTRAMRGTDSDIFYKKASFPQLRLHITSGEEQSDLLLTGHRFSSNTIDKYDAKQLEGSSRLSLGTLLYGRAYDIESVPELSGHEFDLVVNAVAASTITFQISDLVGLEGKQVYLEDREQGILSNLSKNSYSTYIKVGKDSDRFKLRIAADQSDYNLWVNDGKVMTYKGEERLNGTITIYGLDGRLLGVSDTNEINNWHSFPTGVYLLTIENEQESYTSKIIKQ